jgi:hypothetical protein
MANEFATDDVRQMGGIALKNALSEEVIQKKYGVYTILTRAHFFSIKGLDQVQEEIHGWGALDETVRTQIKRTVRINVKQDRPT